MPRVVRDVAVAVAAEPTVREYLLELFRRRVQREPSHDPRATLDPSSARPASWPPFVSVNRRRAHDLAAGRPVDVAGWELGPHQPPRRAGRRRYRVERSGELVELAAIDERR